MYVYEVHHVRMCIVGVFAICDKLCSNFANESLQMLFNRWVYVCMHACMYVYEVCHVRRCIVCVCVCDM
jgi:hypothetical protein